MKPYRIYNLGGVIIRIADGLRFDPQDNAEYLAWIAAGNTPDPYDATKDPTSPSYTGV